MPQGALENRQLSSEACCMLMKVKGLRSPIRTTINGHATVLYTNGWVVHILNRTPWTLQHWQRIGLFPKAPFTLNPSNRPAKRWLWPEPFLQSLKVIGKSSYYGDRLDRADFQRFHDDVFAAYEKSVKPLLARAVIESTPGVFDRDDWGQPQSSYA